jgi:hypothetical protein
VGVGPVRTVESSVTFLIVSRLSRRDDGPIRYWAVVAGGSTRRSARRRHGADTEVVDGSPLAPVRDFR